MWRYAFILWALIGPLTPCLATQGPSAESVQGSVAFRVSLSKASFVVAEPVIATFSVTNQSANPQKLAEPTVSYGIVGYNVEKVSGDEPLPTMMLPSMPSAPDDYGWDFRPGETRVTETDLLGLFADALPVGRYRLVATYTGPGHVNGIWHGTIRVQVEFTVVEPTGVDAAASKAFRDARFRRRGSGTKTAAEVLAELGAPDKGGVFAKYAGFWRAVAYQDDDPKDADRFLQAMDKYSRTHAHVPFAGRRAVEMVGMRFFLEGRYAEARVAFLRLPDGYVRRHWVRRCDEKLGK